MNKKLGLAVAGALLAASASANAGITIPAGDWTVDIGGNVNTYYTHTTYSGEMFKTGSGNELGAKSANQVSTGLLPSAIGIGGKTRQNDLDIAFNSHSLLARMLKTLVLVVMALVVHKATV